MRSRRFSPNPRGQVARATWAFLLVLGLSGGCATFPAADGGSLREEIDEIISTPPLDQVNWGIRIADPDRGQILYSRHAHLKFVPASNQKLLSTAAALSLLGSDYRYQTELHALGELGEDGVLRGDVLLQGVGDPTFSERFYPSAEAPLDSLAQGLWDAGVRAVSGSLLVDVSAWDSTTVPGTWEVADLPATFASTGGAFAIGEGTFSVEITGGAEVGAPAQAIWWPHLDEEFLSVGYVTVHPDSSTRGRSVDYLPESRRIRASGKIRIGEVDTIRVNQREPVRFASAALLNAIERRGIQVTGGLRIGWDRGEPVGPDDCTTPVSEVCPHVIRISGVSSPPMAEIAKAILEPSQNWIAEQLIRTLGMELGEKGSWEEGFRVEREFLTEEVGIDTLDITLRDASGISAKNLITPRAIVRILDYMRASPHSGVFRNALASPGEEESTLEDRLLALQGRVFGKTGTITHVNSLSGYLFTESGKELIFSILTNGSGLPSPTVRAGIDKVVEVSAGH